MPYLDSLLARGIISPGALDRVSYLKADLLRKMMIEGGGRGIGPPGGASGRRVVAPDYGAEAASAAANMSRNDLSNLRGTLRDKLYNEKSLKALDKKTQDFFETKMKTPKGYRWENGKLVEDQ